MFGGFGLTELLVVLAIVLLIFGPKRLKTLGSDLGSAIKGFRSAVSEDESKADKEDPRVIEGELTIVTDSGEEVTLRPGDTYVQNGTNKTLNNRGKSRCVVGRSSNNGMITTFRSWGRVVSSTSSA